MGRGDMRGREEDPGPVCTLKGDKLKTPKPEQVVILSPTGQPCACWHHADEISAKLGC